MNNNISTKIGVSVRQFLILLGVTFAIITIMVFVSLLSQSTAPSQITTQSPRNNSTEQNISAIILLPTVTSTPTFAPSPSQPTQISPTDLPPFVSPEDIAAIINDIPISKEVLLIIQNADQAMVLLLDSQASSEDVLSRLINLELVWQDAIQAGYKYNAETTSGTLDSFLSSRGKTKSELMDALSIVDLPFDDFLFYYGQLLIVDDFSRLQAEKNNLTVAQFIEELQKSSRISIGPAASLIESTNSSPTEPLPTVVQQTPSIVENGTDVASLGTNPGNYSPDFKLPALNGKQDFSTKTDFLGKPIVLSFWASWCPYCQKQTPTLIESFERYGTEIHFIGINYEESLKTVQDYLIANNIFYPVLLDQNGITAQDYGVLGFPTTFFLDANGIIVTKHIGSLNDATMEKYLSKLLQQ